MFYTWTRNAHDIHFLESVLTDRAGIHLTGKNHHRNAVGIRSCDAGDGVGGAGAASDQGNADLVGSSGVGVRSMCCRLLMTNKDVFEFILFVDRVKNI